jgi:hypothetical protein
MILGYVITAITVIGAILFTIYFVPEIRKYILWKFYFDFKYEKIDKVIDNYILYIIEKNVYYIKSAFSDKTKNLDINDIVSMLIIDYENNKFDSVKLAEEAISKSMVKNNKNGVSISEIYIASLLLDQISAIKDKAEIEESERVQENKININKGE